jgi:hypothetical protein
LRREIYIHVRGDPMAQPPGPFKRFLMSIVIAIVAIAIMIAALVLGLSLMLIIFVMLTIAILVAIARSMFSRPKRIDRM